MVVGSHVNLPQIKGPGLDCERVDIEVSADDIEGIASYFGNSREAGD